MPTQKMYRLLLAVAAVMLIPTTAAADCRTIPDQQKRLACYDSAAKQKPGKAAKAPSNCTSFEVASNALRKSLEAGLLRYDMVATGVAKLIAQREQCLMATERVPDNPAYEQNIQAFQDIYQALVMTDDLCRNPQLLQFIPNCNPNTLPITSGYTYGCQVFYKAIPKHTQWINDHCNYTSRVSELVAHILSAEVTTF